MPKSNRDKFVFGLSEFIYEFGSPENLTSYGSGVHTGPNTHFIENLIRDEIKHGMSIPKKTNYNP